MYRYRLFDPDGGDVGEATYAVWITEGETIVTGDGRSLRVTAVVQVMESDSPFVGFLSVELIQ